MAVRIETIQNLLDEREWAACSDLAARALREREWKQEEKAFIYFAKCRSLSNLERYMAALQPGQLATYLAEEARDYDLLGRALLELALVQHQLGMDQAIYTQERFFEFFPRYKAIRDRYLMAQFNLGTYLRAAGRYAEAVEQFKKTHREARERGDHQIAARCRNAAVWESLRLGRTSEAESLIEEPGKDIKDPDLVAGHLVNLAQLALLKQNLPSACAFALEAAVLAKDAPDQFAMAMEILHRVAEQTGDLEASLAAALIGKLMAEFGERQDLAAQIRASVRSLSMRHPEAVERFMGVVNGKK